MRQNVCRPFPERVALTVTDLCWYLTSGLLRTLLLARCVVCVQKRAYIQKGGGGDLFPVDSLGGGGHISTGIISEWSKCFVKRELFCVIWTYSSSSSRWFHYGGFHAVTSTMILSQSVLMNRKKTLLRFLWLVQGRKALLGPNATVPSLVSQNVAL